MKMGIVTKGLATALVAWTLFWGLQMVLTKPDGQNGALMWRRYLMAMSGPAVALIATILYMIWAVE